MADETAVLFEVPPAPAALPAGRFDRRPGLVAVVLLIAAGAALMLLAAAADQGWFDRHSLPHMFLSRGRQLFCWQAERATAILLGMLLIWPVRRRVSQRIRDGRGSELGIQCLLAGLAILLSLAASEFVLRTAGWRGIDRWAASE